MSTTTTRDLARHAGDKVSTALRDISSLEDSPMGKVEIALAAASVCLAISAGYLTGAARLRGQNLSQDESFAVVLDALRPVLFSLTESAEANEHHN